MTKKKKALYYIALEAAIEGFGEAMRRADLGYVAERGRWTTNMCLYWNKYVDVCRLLNGLRD